MRLFAVLLLSAKDQRVYTCIKKAKKRRYAVKAAKRMFTRRGKHKTVSVTVVNRNVLGLQGIARATGQNLMSLRFLVGQHDADLTKQGML